MIKTPRILSPRNWRKNKKKNKGKIISIHDKNNKRRIGNRKNNRDLKREKSSSMRNLRDTMGSRRKKFMEKRPSLWELSSQENPTMRHPKVKPLPLEKLKNPLTQGPNVDKNGFYVVSSEDWETESSDSEFVHLMPNLEPNLTPPKSRIRSASSIKTEVLADMQKQIIDKDEEKSESSSEFSVFQVKLEDDIYVRDFKIGDPLENLGNWRIRKTSNADTQVSIWKIRNSKMGLLTLEALKEFDRVVIDKSSQNYSFIQTSKSVDCH